MQTLRQQVRGNSVALISLMTALLALSYDTWRNETTESQRNICQASFQVPVKTWQFAGSGALLLLLFSI